MEWVGSLFVDGLDGIEGGGGYVGGWSWFVCGLGERILREGAVVKGGEFYR